jgi:hypothetical protein
MRKLICTLSLLFCPSVAQASLVAAYTFNNTFAAVEPGVAALTSVNPEGTGMFQTATVFGASRTTWHFDGTASPPADQGGLDFLTTGLISSNNYSVEIVFELTTVTGSYKRILDSLDRQSDNGFYVDPNSQLNEYPNGSGGTPLSANTFYDVFVTVDPSNNVAAYIGSTQQFTTVSPNLDVTTNTLGFFLDNVVGGGQGEWSSGNVALIKVFNTALTPTQVTAEAANPFQGTSPLSSTPEPATLFLLAGAAAALAFYKRRTA